MAKDIPAATRRKVAGRDGYACVRCGGSSTDVHHRQRRRDGKHGAANLVSICRRCHGDVHANPSNAQACGYIVPANGRATSDVIPVLTYAPGLAGWDTHVWYVLDDDGGRVRIPDAEAHELLAAFGIHWEGVL